MALQFTDLGLIVQANELAIQYRNGQMTMRECARKIEELISGGTRKEVLQTLK
ncbi:MAG TPA: hypothetical protein QF480_00835 [Bacteroidales bacterium]|jgi:hypothetical protein|nr:hypothetical protein [Bacteroidales bacterium]